MKKRLLSAILSFCMLLTMAPTVAFAAKEDRPEGAAGITVAAGVADAQGVYISKESDSVWYKIDTATKTLTIGGQGEIPDYAYTSNATQLDFRQAAWYDQRNEIENVVIEDGITRIGWLAITNMQHLKSIEIKGTDVMLADGAVNNYEGNQNTDKTLTITVPLSVYQQNQMENKKWFSPAGHDNLPDPTIKFAISDADKIAEKYQEALSFKESDSDKWDKTTIGKITTAYEEYETLPEVVKSALQDSVGDPLKALYDIAIAKRGWPVGAKGINIAQEGFNGTNGKIGISDTFWYLLDGSTLKLGGKGDFPSTGYDSTSSTNGNLGFTRASWYNDRASITTVDVAEDVTALDYLNLTNLYKCDDIYLRNPDITLKQGAVCGYAGDEDGKLTLHLYKNAYDKKVSDWYIGNELTAPKDGRYTNPTISYSFLEAEDFETKYEELWSLGVSLTDEQKQKIKAAYNEYQAMDTVIRNQLMNIDELSNGQTYGAKLLELYSLTTDGTVGKFPSTNDIYYSYNEETQTLTLTYTGNGTGTIPSYTKYTVPLSNVPIKNVVVSGNISHIGAYALANHGDITVYAPLNTTLDEKYAEGSKVNLIYSETQNFIDTYAQVWTLTGMVPANITENGVDKNTAFTAVKNAVTAYKDLDPKVKKQLKEMKVNDDLTYYQQLLKVTGADDLDNMTKISGGIPNGMDENGCFTYMDGIHWTLTKNNDDADTWTIRFDTDNGVKAALPDFGNSTSNTTATDFRNQPWYNNCLANDFHNKITKTYLGEGITGVGKLSLTHFRYCTDFYFENPEGVNLAGYAFDYWGCFPDFKPNVYLNSKSTLAVNWADDLNQGKDETANHTTADLNLIYTDALAFEHDTAFTSLWSMSAEDATTEVNAAVIKNAMDAYGALTEKAKAQLKTDKCNGTDTYADKLLALAKAIGQAGQVGTIQYAISGDGKTLTVSGSGALNAEMAESEWTAAKVSSIENLVLETPVTVNAGALKNMTALKNVNAVRGAKANGENVFPNKKNLVIYGYADVQNDSLESYAKADNIKFQLKELNILCIGNSHTEDYTTYMQSILNDVNADLNGTKVTFSRIVYGSRKIGLTQHYTGSNGSAVTNYSHESCIQDVVNKVNGSSATSSNDVEGDYFKSLNPTDNTWDLIIIQDYRESCVGEDTNHDYVFIDHLHNAIQNLRELQPTAQVAWFMDWLDTYDKDTSYENYSLKNYKLASEKNVAGNPDFIVAGATFNRTALTSYLGSVNNLEDTKPLHTSDTTKVSQLWRDGTHMSYETGRYLAGASVAAKVLTDVFSKEITFKDGTDFYSALSYNPNSKDTSVRQDWPGEFTPEIAEIVKASAKAAIDNPTQITKLSDYAADPILKVKDLVEKSTFSNMDWNNATIKTAVEKVLSQSQYKGATVASVNAAENTATVTLSYGYSKTDAEIKLTHKSNSSSGSSSSSATNTVSASTASNGKVSLDKNTAKKGNTVTVTVTPDAGYQLDKLTVTDAKGKTIAVTKKSDSKYTFTMPDSRVTITPTFSKIEDTKPSKNGFVDVASSAWYADAVQYVTDKGLMNGTGSDTFSPNASTTRGMLMTVLARYAGEDTTGGATWYEKGMNWAKAKGVSDGTNPEVNITREQLVTMLYRYAGSPAANGSLDSFSDASTVSTYAVNAMQWAVENDIVNGSNGKLNPQNNATRAEVAAILMRFCEMSK